MTLFASIFGGQDWVVLLILGFVLFVIFGRRMPEVGRSLGKGIMEFKKGIKGLEDDPGDNYYSGNSGANGQQQQPQAPRPPQAEPPRPPQRITSAAPKFDEPTNPDAPPRI